MENKSKLTIQAFNKRDSNDMENKSKQTIQAFNKRYSDDESRLLALLYLRTNGSNKCLNPQCTGQIDKHYRHLKWRNKEDKSKKALICKKCLIHVHPLADGPFDHCKLPLKDIFQITFDVMSSSSGISANYIHRKYGYAYSTAHSLLHRIREHMGTCLPKMFYNSVVEIDESFVSTGNKGFHRHFHFKRGRGSEKNSTVLAIVERYGKCILIKIPDATSDTLMNEILEHVDKSCKIYTDNLPAYGALSKLGYTHSTVNHKSSDGTKKWVDGSASTNSAENVFSILKRLIDGAYRSVSDEHLQNYLNEISFKYSNRFAFDYGFEQFLQSMPPLTETYRFKNVA